MPNQKLDRRRLMLIHASVLLGFVLPPVGPAAGPWLAWKAFRNHPLADWHGRRALNFQLTTMLIEVLLMVALLGLMGWLLIGAFNGVPTTSTDLLTMVPSLLDQYSGDSELNSGTVAKPILILIGVSALVIGMLGTWFLSFAVGLWNAFRAHTDDHLQYPFAIRFLPVEKCPPLPKADESQWAAHK